MARSGSKKSYDWFRPNHVDEVMEKLVGHAKIADRIPDSMVTMSLMLKRRRMVPKTEIEHFRKTYVSAARLAAQVGESRVTITAKMARIGVDQIDTGKARIILFEREKVAHLMSG